VSRDGGNLVRWRGDSKELFFIAPNGDVMAASVDGSGTALVTGELKKLFESNIRTVGFAGSNSHNYDVTPDGQRFLIAVTDGTTSQPPTTLLVNWTSALRP
jgi:hypothetical protein